MEQNPNLKSPELKDSQVETKDPVISGETGGVTLERSKETDWQRDEMAEKMKEGIEAKMGDKDIKEEERVIDTSFVKNKIAELKEKKVGFFKRMFSDTEETAKRLNKGLMKIEDPRFKGAFAKHFMDALEQGGEKLALEYVEAIGNGELVRPENGVLMTNTSQETFFPQ